MAAGSALVARIVGAMRENGKGAKKQSCLGCKALLSISRKKFRCQLNFGINLIDNSPLRPTPAPANMDCPKPRTYEALTKVFQDRRKV